MSIKPDVWIHKHAANGMIEPFSAGKNNENGMISWGLSSYGYDIRCGDSFKVGEDHQDILDPKNPDSFRSFTEHTHLKEPLILPPHAFALTHSLETIHVPDNVLVLCLGKSTYARCGLIVNVTPLEPGWKGQITMELSNTTGLPLKIYPNEGIAQLLFFEGDRCARTYGKGKYQDQVGITLPR